jgi:hypothetical protein
MEIIMISCILGGITIFLTLAWLGAVLESRRNRQEWIDYLAYLDEYSDMQKETNENPFRSNLTR